jgi:hypothetical protein
MRRGAVLWSIAIAITLGSAVYQRVTGPTYPVRGAVEFMGSRISYDLPRTHGGPGDQPVTLSVPDTTVSGSLLWRHHKSSAAWTRVPLVRADGDLSGAIPHQPPAGKLEYHIQLEGGGKTITVPLRENVVTRFKGDVPGAVLIPHVLFMFFGMLVSTRAGLEALAGGGRTGRYAIAAAGLLFAGGMVFGPLVQKHAFDAYWTGFPRGMDLTDNKTLISMIVWVAALVAMWKKARPRWWILGASAVTLIIFMIPHSMQGSELAHGSTRAGAEAVASAVTEETGSSGPSHLSF